MTCRIVPSLPAASSAWSTTSTAQLSCAARRAWYSVSSRTPSCSRATPSFFFLTPALNAGSKSVPSVIFEPGLTRNGSMNSAALLFLSSSAIVCFISVEDRANPARMASTRGATMRR